MFGMGTCGTTLAIITKPYKRACLLSVLPQKRQGICFSDIDAIFSSFTTQYCFVLCVSGSSEIKPIEQLVPVSYVPYGTSTPGLSTWWSSTALIGKTSFEVGFTLRCIQRLSLPYIATLRCRWRDNRYTRGMSNPVLSY